MGTFEMGSSPTRILAVLAIALSGLAQAQTYPTKPIRVVIPFPAGGSGDFVGRLVGAKLTEAWGQQIVIDYRPGANGTIGAESVVRAPADGYTLLLGNDQTMVILPHIERNMPFKPQTDFALVVQATFVEYVLAINASIPANNLSQLVAYFKASPGKYSYGSVGNGSIHHVSMEMLKNVAGIDVLHVPYKGAAQIITDMTSGQIQTAYLGIPQTMPHAKSGKLKAIAIGSARRLDAAPEVPPIAETFPGFETTTSWNYYAPAGTPRDIVMKLNVEINKILAIPEVRERLTSQGLSPIGGSPEQFAARMKADSEKWGAVVRTARIKAD